jgi:hypothetical protein
VRKWALKTLKALGPIRLSDYQDNGIGDMLRKWADQLQHSDSLSAGSRIMRAMGDCLEMLDNEALEQFVGHCPMMFDVMVGNLIHEAHQSWAYSAVEPCLISDHSILYATGLCRSIKCFLNGLGARLWLVSSDLLRLSPLDLLVALSKMSRRVNREMVLHQNGSLGKYLVLVNQVIRVARGTLKVISELKWRWPTHQESKHLSQDLLHPSLQHKEGGFVLQQNDARRKPICCGMGDEQGVPSATSTALAFSTEAVLYSCVQMKPTMTASSSSSSHITSPTKELQKFHSEVVLTICECLMQYYTIVPPDVVNKGDLVSPKNTSEV